MDIGLEAEDEIRDSTAVVQIGETFEVRTQCRRSVKTCLEGTRWVQYVPGTDSMTYRRRSVVVGVQIFCILYEVNGGSVG